MHSLLKRQKLPTGGWSKCEFSEIHLWKFRGGNMVMVVWVGKKKMIRKVVWHAKYPEILTVSTAKGLRSTRTVEALKLKLKWIFQQHSRFNSTKRRLELKIKKTKLIKLNERIKQRETLKQSLPVQLSQSTASTLSSHSLHSVSLSPLFFH